MKINNPSYQSSLSSNPLTLSFLSGELCYDLLPLIWTL